MTLPGRAVADGHGSGQTAPVLTTLQSFVAVPFVVLIVFLVLMAVARPDLDDRGEGLYAVYLAVVGITALYLLLILGATSLGAITQRAIVDEHASSAETFDGSLDTAGLPTSAFVGGSDETQHGLVRSAVFNGLFAVAAGAVFVYHLRRRRELASGSSFPGSAAERVDRAYVAVVAFVAVVVGISAFAVAGYGTVRILAPDVTGRNDTFESQLGLSQLIAYGGLVVVCGALFRTHFWRIRPDVENTENIKDLENLEP
jgi:hypothetical protein